MPTLAPQPTTVITDPRTLRRGIVGIGAIVGIAATLRADAVDYVA